MALKPLNSVDGFSVGANSIINVIDANGNVTANTLTVDTQANLGSVSNITITGGTYGQVLTTDGAGNLSFTTANGSGSSNLAAVMPTYIPSASSYTVQSNFQGLFGAPITIDGTFEVDGTLVDVGGNIVVNNGVLQVSNITATGNVTGNYIIGNGYYLTGISGGGTATALNATIANVKILGGTNGYVLQTDGTGNLSWTAQTGGGGNGTPGGTNTQIQFNNNGAFGGSANLEFDYANNNLVVTGNVTSTGIFTGNAYGLNHIPGANVTGAVAYATTANAVAGANVSGQVSYAATANSVAGANVTGAVAYATTANAVAGANVSGQVGNALIAGTVYTNAQPNITSVGTLQGLVVHGNITPDTDVTYSLGNATNRFANLFLAGNTIILGDSTISSNTGAVTLTNPNGGSLSIVGNTAANTASIVNGNSNVIAYNDDNVAVSVNQVSNVLVVTTVGANISGNLDVTTNITSGNVYSNSGTIKAAHLIGEAGNLSNITGSNVSGQVSFAATANLVAGANVTGTVANANYSVYSGTASTANSVAGANVSGAVAYATTANAVAGANVSGAVAYATTANAVAGGNVSGQVGNALIAGTIYTNAQPNITSVGTLTSLAVTGNVSAANITGNHYGAGNNLSNIQGSNVSGAVAYATTANAVAGANVSGAVAYATTANAVAGANVSGAVAYATTANAVAGANVTGAVGNALVAGTVYTNAQPNITSVGTLTSLSVTGNANVGNIGATNAVISGAGSFGANVNMNNFYVNNLSNPQDAQDAATKAYVDAAVTSIHVHAPVYAATTGTIATATGGTVTYNNGSSGIGANLVTTGTFHFIDGSNVQTVGTRILVKNEANGVWNGIYTYANTTTIVRATDFDTTGLVGGGDFVFVQTGTTQADTGWVQTTPNVVIGVDNIEFIQFSSAGAYTAGTGLTLTGTQFSITNTTVTAGSYGNGDRIASFTVNQQGQLTAASNVVNAPNAANLTGTALASGIVTSSLTSVGTLSSLTVTNKVTAGQLQGDGGNISNIQGANVSGAVAYATTANSVAGANVSGAVGLATYATTANSVAGANVSGAVGLATYATTANSVAGANVSGAVAYATTANSVAGGNVSGQVGNALVAGTVYTNAQPNITSVGTLTNLAVTGNITSGNFVGVFANGNSNVNIPAANGNINISAVGNANILVITGTGVNVSGTLNATGNANVGNIGATTAVVTTGNITTVNGNIANASTVVANGSNGVVFANSHTISGAASGNVNVATVLGNLGLRSVASTYTDNVAAAGTIATAAIHAIATPTLTASNAITTSNLATFYIQSAPTASTNVTATNSYAMFIAAGNSYFGANVTVANLIGPHANGNSNVNIPSANGNVNITAVGNTTLVVTGTGANITGTANISGNLSAANATFSQNIIPSTVSNTGGGGWVFGLGGWTGSAPANTGTNSVTSLYYNGGSGSQLFTLGSGPGQASFQVDGSIFAGDTIGFNPDAANGSVKGALVAQSSIAANGNIYSNTSIYANTGTVGAANITVGANGNITMSGINSQLTGANSISSNYYTGTLTTGNQPNITTIGTLGNLNVTSNAIAGHFKGEAGNLSNIQGSNVSGAVSSATTAGTVTTNAQPNITSVGTLTSVAVTNNGTFGNVYANSGIVQGQYLYGDGSNITNVAVSAGSYIQSGTSNASIDGTGNFTVDILSTLNVFTVSSTGVFVSGTANVSGNITVANANVTANLSVSGNANIAGNLNAGNISNTRINTRTSNNGATLSGTLTPNTDTTDQYNLIGINGNVTIAAPSGTFIDGQKFTIRIKDNGVSQNLSWSTGSANSYRQIGVTLPTTTTPSKVIYVGCIYNIQDTYWDVIAVAQQA